MDNALFWHRLQFGFTVTYHYLFPQLTMGLAGLIFLLRIRALREGDEAAAGTARFWTRIFGICFAAGVVTGIPLEFQFGTNWARFSTYSGGVIGQSLAMEGLFAFFLESSFLGLVLYGEGKLSQRAHLFATGALWLGSWLSGYFIIATNAFMQHPVGYALNPNGTLALAGFWDFLLNPWALWQYAHNMCASVVTASFAVAGVGALWTLQGRSDGRASLRIGVTAALVACALQIFPTGDQHGKMLAQSQPVALAAMEGLFEGKPDAEIAILGQPDVPARKLENPLVVPRVLSFLAYGSFASTVKGLNDFPENTWPDNIELLYYAYHVMVGLGTLMLALAALAFFQLWRGKLESSRGLLWALLLSIPFPYIATTAGWMTAELGRQPWLVYGLLRTDQGTSAQVSAGNVAFTALGFSGLYFLLTLLLSILISREIGHGVSGPHDSTGAHSSEGTPAAAEPGAAAGGAP